LRWPQKNRHVQLSGAPVQESDENKPGVTLDYDKDGSIVGIEILNALKRMENPRAQLFIELRLFLTQLKTSTPAA
jgi:uncharacterized protein YuzE